MSLSDWNRMEKDPEVALEYITLRFFVENIE